MACFKKNKNRVLTNTEYHRGGRREYEDRIDTAEEFQGISGR
jgi:hypothetical protein